MDQIYLPMRPTPLRSEERRVGKEALKTGSNIITDILNKEPEQTVGNIFKNRLKKQKGTLKKIKNMTVSCLGLKRKRKLKKVPSQSKRRKMKDIFTEDKKNRKKNK